MTENDPLSKQVLADLASLATTSTPHLRVRWRKLFDSEPPQYNRKFLESRLAYRIQELAFGGLKLATVERLQALGEELDGGKLSRRKIRGDRDLGAGTELKRDWQGVEQIVLVTRGGYEWHGRPYKSLSAVARAITGTRWNGWIFFGLKRQGTSV